jgi:hypothetical protein
MTKQLFFTRGRVVTLGSTDDSMIPLLPLPFAALVPAFNDAERERVEELGVKLVEMGCTEFCCVGPQAEILHDALDSIIEKKEAFHIVTTWHEDEADACEYFLFAAGTQYQHFFAMIGLHPELLTLLERTALSE